MKIQKYFIPAVVAFAGLTALTACSDKEYWEAAPGLTGNNVVLENTASSECNLTFRPSNEPGVETVIPDPVFELPLRRGTTEGSETIQLSVVMGNADGKFEIKDENDEEVDVSRPNDGTWTIPASVTFADGEDTVLIPVKLNKTMDDLGLYTARVTPSNVDPYASVRSWTLSVSIQGAMPDPVWESLGMGTYINLFFFENKYKVEVEKDNAPYSPDQLGFWGHYRLVKPMAEGLEAEGYGDVTPAEYAEFYVMGPGETIPNTDVVTPSIDKDGFPTYVYYRAFTSGWVHSSYGVEIVMMFGANLTGAELDDFGGQIVLGWKKAPVYDPENAENNVPGELGAVSMGCYPYMSGAGGWDYLTDTKMFRFIFPGYSLGDFSFELGYMGQGMNADKSEYVEVSVDFTGKDASQVALCAVETTDASYAQAVLMNSLEAEPSPEYEVVDVITVDNPNKKKDNVATARITMPGSGKYIIAAASFDADGDAQETSAMNLTYTAIADMSSSDWEDLGTGIYRDDILSYWYEIDPQDCIYYVPIQKSKTTEGLYRLVNPYGVDNYPYTLGDFSEGDEYMQIDCKNPQCVKVPDFYVGYFEGFSEYYAMSVSYYYSVYGYSDDVIIANGLGGELEDGMITFTTPNSFIGMLPDYTDQLLNCNWNGAFAVVLPSAAKAKAASFAAKSKPAGYATKNFKKALAMNKLKVANGLKGLGFSAPAKTAKNPSNLRVFQGVPYAL